MSSTAKGFLRRHTLSAEEYRRMGEAGIIAPDARVELIDGEIIDMAPIGSRHGGTVEQLADLLRQAARGRAMVRTQNPVSLGTHSEPQPDIALVRPCQDFYKSGHPRPADVLLIVEVADTSLRYDHEVKVPLYARYGVPEVWVIDAEGRRLTRFRDPRERVYARTDVPDVGAIAVRAFNDVPLDLRSLFTD